MENMENINNNEENAKKEALKVFFEKKAKEANLARFESEGDQKNDEEIETGEVERYKLRLFEKMAETGAILEPDDLLELEKDSQEESQLDNDLHLKFWDRAVSEVGEVWEVAENSIINSSDKEPAE